MNDAMKPFVLVDCSLVRYATGRAVLNLRELLAAVRNEPDEVLEHHMMRCVLEDVFELYEFPNDLARWCWTALGDHVLAEKLGLVDPYQHESLSSLRAALANLIEERLWGLDHVPWCQPGMEGHIMESKLIAYDTGERFTTPVTLAEALPRMSVRSLFYHVHEARRRTHGQTDDFSLWLEDIGAHPELVRDLRAIDFYFLNLHELRVQFLKVFRHYLPDIQVPFLSV
ncbi:MAG: DUF5752 family protein [Gemmataceae bacterium]